MPTNKQLTDLVINKVESQEVYDYMVENNLINDDELYLVGGEAKNTAVLYTPQELDDDQKAQVLANISAASQSEVAEIKVDISTKMDATNPTGTGSFSFNRKADTTVGTHSVALGYNSTASGSNSFAAGPSAVASGMNSLAIGNTAKATEQCAIALGNYVEASGVNSVALGQGIATGKSSLAEGSSRASGAYSHAEGQGTTATGDAQHVQGRYNLSSGSQYAHVVGNGESSDAKSNAHTLDWEGNAWFAGDIKVGGTGQNDVNAKIVPTMDYVDNSIATIETMLDEIRMTANAIILTDEVNGYDYVITMRNGTLVSSLIPSNVVLNTMPNKTSYIAGEYFDPTGMVILATYPDSTTNNIDGYVCSADMIGLSDTSIQISCMVAGIEYSFTLNLTVTELDASQLQDFEYTVEDGIYTLTAWKGTVNGTASTEMVVPDLPVVIAFEG